MQRRSGYEARLMPDGEGWVKALGGADGKRAFEKKNTRQNMNKGVL